MRILLKIMLVMVLAVQISACASTSLFSGSSTKSSWPYEKNAIKLNFTADPELNLYQRQAHSLMICAYHLKDLNGFNQLLDEKGGIERLLECNRFDNSVTYTRRFVIQPQQNLIEEMNRTEDAKYVGIVAGYYDLTKEHAVRLHPVPLSWLKNPKKLNVNLYLGAEGLEERDR